MDCETEVCFSINFKWILKDILVFNISIVLSLFACHNILDFIEFVSEVSYHNAKTCKWGTVKQLLVLLYSPSLSIDEKEDAHSYYFAYSAKRTAIFHYEMTDFFLMPEGQYKVNFFSWILFYKIFAGCKVYLYLYIFYFTPFWTAVNAWCHKLNFCSTFVTAFAVH